MGLFDWAKKASATVPIKLSSIFSNTNITPLSNLTSYLNLYTTDPYVSRATNLIGAAVSKSKRKVVDSEGKSIDHPILELFENPNCQGSSYFFGSAAKFLVLGGETFWEVVTPNRFKTPKELYNLRPDRIEIVPDEDKKDISGYLYKISTTKKETFNKDEILQIKTFHPTDDWRGMPAAKPLEKIINADRHGWEWIKDFLNKKGVLKGFLTASKSINKASAERLKSKWEVATSSDGVPLLPGDIDWKNIARPPKESGMVDLVEHISNTKLQTIGVPKGLLGSFDRSSEGLDIQVNLFYSMTVTPYINLMEDKINNTLMPRFSKPGTFKFDTNNIGLLDFETFVSSLAEQFDRGALTPNQFTEETGIGTSFENGDSHYLDGKRQEIESKENTDITE